MAIFITLFLLTVCGFIYFSGFFETKNLVNIPREGPENVSDQELREKIGQMLILGFNGTLVTQASPIVKAIRDLSLGGIILFDYNVADEFQSRNIISPEQTKTLISDLQKFSATPLFVAIDAEGGKVNRLKEKYGFINVPSAESLGKKSVLETEKAAQVLAAELSTLGINLNLAPVVDVNVNPRNPIIGSLARSFSSDPQEVLSHSLAFIEAHHQNNVLVAIKHFPGHGSSEEDSHEGLVDITDTYQDSEMIPFREIIGKNQADMVMAAHLMNLKIDPNYPASLSSIFIKDILQGELGFKGLVISDDMQMGAIEENYSFKRALILAINAGCDLLIISNNGKTYNERISYEASDIVFDAVRSGEIPLSRVLESSEKIEKTKRKLKLF